jgi:HK97 family phage portal protein
MLDLIESPNPYYDGLLLQQATVADFTIAGNAYWRKIRSAGNRVVELWWIPSPLIDPAWGNNSSEYITHYEYSPGGMIEKIDPQDIVHFRYGLDPNNIRKGLSPLGSLFREVFTDDEAANMTAALLKNLGVPGVVISPKDSQGGMGPDVAAEIKDTFKRSTTGDKRGEPLVMSGATDISQFGFSPQQMDMKQLRRIPEERISGVLGVPAIVAGLGAGLERSTFANFAEAREMAYESNIIPSQRVIGSVIKRQLLNEFEDDITSFQVAYDLREVRVLQEDENKKASRIKDMVAGGFVTVADAQRETGMPVDETQNIYLRSVMVMGVPASTKASNIPVQRKEIDWTEEQKSMEWKRADRQRMAWWGPVSQKFEPLYEDEGDAVIKAIMGKSPSKLVKIAERAVKGLEADWLKLMEQVLLSVIDEFGNSTADDLGAKGVGPFDFKWEFDPTSEAIRAWIKLHGAEDVTSILSANMEDVKRVILSGVDANQTTPQIAKNLRQFYSDRSPYKAMRVARTEITKASGFGNLEAAKQSQVAETKTWLSSRDDRVRDEHEAMDGETVKLNEQFSNGLDYPSEPMCRCVLTFHTGR